MTVDRDKDNDIEASHDDTVNRNAEFGRPASDSDRRAIVALLKRYYRAALAENGAKACSMLYSTIAESVPEDYGSFAGPAYMRGNTCPTVLTKLFEHFHKLLAIELPKMTVMAVRLEEHHGLALLRFGRLPERQIAVAREGRTWRISALLDGELT